MATSSVGRMIEEGGARLAEGQVVEPISAAELAALAHEPETMHVSVTVESLPIPTVLPDALPDAAAEDAAEQALMALDAHRLAACRTAAGQARILSRFAAARARLDPWRDVTDGPIGPERSVRVGGPGTPTVEEFACAEVGAVLGISSRAARGRLADALDLVHRHPDTLAALDAGRIDGFRAVLLVRGTRRLDEDKAAQVEAELLGRAGRLSIRQLVDQVKAAAIAVDPALAENERATKRSLRWVWFGEAQDGVREMNGWLDAAAATRLEQRVDEVTGWLGEVARADGTECEPQEVRRSTALGLLADPDEVRRLWQRVQALRAGSDEPRSKPVPVTVLHVHVGADSDAARRWRSAEHGPLTPDEAADLVGHSNVFVKPVIDLPAFLDADPEPQYRPSDRLAEAVDLAFEDDVFPYSPTAARHCDDDHDVAWPPGPTHLSNLSPKGRFHHRVKTFGGWTVYRLGPRLHEWTSPTGRRYRVDPTGTRRLPSDPDRAGPAP